MTRAWLAVVLALGCAQVTQAQVSPHRGGCRRSGPGPGGELDDDTPASQFAGTWDVWMVVDSGRLRGRSVVGRLTLADLGARVTERGASGPRLDGWAELALDSLGAGTAYPISSRESARPGAWAELLPHRLLRIALGRPVDHSFTAWTDLNVWDSRSDPLRGDWTSGTTDGTTVRGHFCAWRVPAP
jgi:hypothetical protein